MRAKRCVRVITRLVLLPTLTAAVLLAPPPPLFAAGPRPAAGPPSADVTAAAVAVAVGEGTGAGADGTGPGADGTGPGAGGTVPAVGRAWPVGLRPPVLRGWEPPATVYGPGHRGVDLAAAPGAPVRAVAAGRVTFAGRVAGKGVVSVELTGTGDPPLRTTYEPVTASVEEGDLVAPGQVIGTVDASGSHCAATCVHWGLRRDGTYLNPLSLLPPWLLRGGPSRLLPVPA
ncbi:murein hydrolase activator EnvC family protein [Streptomyces sp. NPDC057794]|uniref:murein hydrolase activator EnvC family protein n=1 Tax=Streptomyces sp. NPDC057794 TaxID=3346251 RepID=UPI0036C5F1ED